MKQRIKFLRAVLLNKCTYKILFQKPVIKYFIYQSTSGLRKFFKKYSIHL